MARKPMIDDTTLLGLIEKYHNDECHRNTKKLKLPAITDYINDNGYPQYKVTTLRRNKKARDYIQSLSDKGSDKLLSIIIPYKNIDIESFLDTNRTRSALKIAITEIDTFYKDIALVAAEVNKKNDSLTEDLKQAKSKLQSAEKEISELKRQTKELRKKLKTTETDKTSLRKTLNNYVYPAIANELLEKEGLKIEASKIINPKILDGKVIKADFNIKKNMNKKSGSAVIKNIYSKFEDDT